MQKKLPITTTRLSMIAGYVNDPLVIVLAAVRAAWPKIDVGVCGICFVVCIMVYANAKRRHVAYKNDKAEEKQFEVDICKDCHLRKKCFEESTNGKGGTAANIIEETANVR
jgi:hypothetical protein